MWLHLHAGRRPAGRSSEGQVNFAHEDALARLAKQYSPGSYLEVGVWRGDSLRVVLDNCLPARLILCDLWSGRYECGFTGHGHIEAMLKQRGFAGAVEYLDGDSHELLPDYFEKGVGDIDLILVDGDHTEYGAWADLVDCWEFLSIGGHIVFDDLLHAGYPHMQETFKRFRERLGAQAALESLELRKMDGCGVLRRLS